MQEQEKIEFGAGMRGPKVGISCAGHRVAELALAWLLAQPTVASVLTGVTSTNQLEANVRAAEWVLEKNQVAELNTLTEPSN